MDYIFENTVSKPLIFDTHAHYDDERFADGLDGLMKELTRHGVGGIITCGCDKVSSEAALKIAHDHPFVYAACGIHPGNLESGTTVAEIAALAEDKRCVAIGEIGLDYYWVDDNKEEQKAVFEEQILLAEKLDLPVIVHDREAHQDTLEILKKHKPKGVIHSFSGSLEMAEEILKMGMYIGVGGVITFKNAKKLPEVVERLPLDRLLLETDAPYLTPVPYRSKINHSAMIALTAQRIAEIKGTDTEEILKISFENSCRLFNI